jgi:hypothetical protein
MGPRDNAVYQISKGCDKKLLRNCYENFQPLMSKFNLVGKQEVDEQQT